MFDIKTKMVLDPEKDIVFRKPPLDNDSGFMAVFISKSVNVAERMHDVYESTRPGITSWFNLAAFRKGNLVEILNGTIKIFRDLQLINELNLPKNVVLFNGEEENNSERYIGNACG